MEQVKLCRIEQATELRREADLVRAQDFGMMQFASRQPGRIVHTVPVAQRDDDGFCPQFSQKRDLGHDRLKHPAAPARGPGSKQADPATGDIRKVRRGHCGCCLRRCFMIARERNSPSKGTADIRARNWTSPTGKMKNIVIWIRTSSNPSRKN